MLTTIRKEFSSPRYNEAFKEGALVDVAPVLAEIDKKITKEFLDGPIHNVLKKARKTISKSATVEESNLKALHGARRTINQQIAQAKGDLASETQRQLLDVKKSLTEQMINKSPLYERARDSFMRHCEKIHFL